MRPEIPILSFLSIISLPLPLFYYLRSGNVAMVAHILWLLCLDITYAVDAIVWANNVDKVATVWCDITTKLMVGWPTALAATCLAFCMRLAMLVSKADEITPTEAYRRRRHTQYREAALCLGLPLAIMAIHCAFQSRRFAVIEDFGCRPSTFVTSLSILFIWCPPLVLALLTIVYAGLLFSLRM
ncbi:fungal pheromone STE3G-protein-coupled receptor [Stereum hirsutum FP-91666 SS1]|uniref:fungal pheromone STE3G-protein-coupled receptor n=1 Tax=Stereum hirsutum (strain FP-91666) TaxID=721885 RepID=UPI000444974D|nr:fungal pheromone STE3G-protein-coupled receptor [Stereum hirsutum FP-91666 SS1]EIM84307.1 fungal pheromone STE3G-protein-coupled receptor [Stereum hirsutum FP-91666 SS1]